MAGWNLGVIKQYQKYTSPFVSGILIPDEIQVQGGNGVSQYFSYIVEVQAQQGHILVIKYLTVQ
jgi:hypothetical protein